MPNRKFVFDFDSTLTSVEGLDVLAEISLKNNPNKSEVINKIQEITDLGIDGDISFSDSLNTRIALLKANRSQLTELVGLLKTKISNSVKKNKHFFKKYSSQIYVISCGFKEFIEPVVAELNINPERIFANSFTYDENGLITGFDESNPLSQHDGKVSCLRSSGIQGEIQIIGDGYSDYVMKREGIADKFFAYTENVTRKKAIDNADYVVANLEEFLIINKL
jgi:D-3-phosphoglycerate dehydrogenase